MVIFSFSALFLGIPSLRLFERSEYRSLIWLRETQKERKIGLLRFFFLFVMCLYLSNARDLAFLLFFVCVSPSFLFVLSSSVEKRESEKESERDRQISLGLLLPPCSSPFISFLSSSSPERVCFDRFPMDNDVSFVSPVYKPSCIPTVKVA